MLFEFALYIEGFQYDGMKKIIIIVSILSVQMLNGATIRELIDALVIVESNGNSQAIGDNGKAYGILQIHEVMIQDCNRIAGTTYTHKDAFEPTVAREIAITVLTHYGKYIKRQKGTLTIQDLARVWNGGGNAWKPQNPSKESNLDNYCQKVFTVLSSN